MYTTLLNRPGASLDRKLLACAVLALVGLFAVGAAHALSSDRDKNLEVRASYNKMVTTKPSFALFKDNVRLEQGSLKASGDEAKVYEGDDSANSGRRIVMTGSPALLEQKQDDSGGLMTARAAQIDYDDGSHIAILTGDVVVVQAGKSEFRGQRMTYNTETGAMEGGSQAPGSEVHMTFKPKPRKTDTPAKDANP